MCHLVIYGELACEVFNRAEREKREKPHRATCTWFGRGGVCGSFDVSGVNRRGIRIPLGRVLGFCRDASFDTMLFPFLLPVAGLGSDSLLSCAAIDLKIMFYLSAFLVFVLPHKAVLGPPKCTATVNAMVVCPGKPLPRKCQI